MATECRAGAKEKPRRRQGDLDAATPWVLETPLKANAALPALEPLLDDCGRCCRAAGVCLWLKTDLQRPEIDFRFAPNIRCFPELG